jgi:hypothetical protein
MSIARAKASESRISKWNQIERNLESWRKKQVSWKRSLREKPRSSKANKDIRQWNFNKKIKRDYKYENAREFQSKEHHRSTENWNR